MKQNSNKTIFLGLAFVFLGIAIALVNRLDLRQEVNNENAKPQGHLAQGLTLERVGNDKIEIHGYEGRPIMINFWASWCPPCIAEMPSIYKLYEKFNGRGFEVLAINLDKNAVRGLKYLEDNVGLPKFPIIKGHGENYPGIFKVDGVPYTVLLDRKGIIRYSRVGERNWIDKESQSLIEGIL